MTTTVVVQIGNSDNKLSQIIWSSYCNDVGLLIMEHQSIRHFSGGPATNSQWQNWCWVFELDTPRADIESFKAELSKIVKRYLQESACVIVGKAEFV